jgi:AraC-like DNA-binding protein
MKQPLKKSRIPEYKAFVVKELFAPFFDKNWHFHQEYQLFLVLEGRGIRFFGDVMKPFKPGDMVFSGPNLPHLWRNDQEFFDKTNGLSTHGIVIYFPEEFMGNAIQIKEEFESIKLMFQKSSRGLEIIGETNLILQQMMKGLLKLKGVESIIQLLKILEIIAHSADCLPIVQADYTNLNKESEKDRMSQVYEFVMDNFQQKIRLEEVSSLANMTVSSFSRYFTSRMNKSFSDFLTDVRISHACKLLHEQDLNISEIGYESGFNTLSNFNKLFKDKMGMTPLVYKKDYLKNF